MVVDMVVDTGVGMVEDSIELVVVVAVVSIVVEVDMVVGSIELVVVVVVVVEL